MIIKITYGEVEEAKLSIHPAPDSLEFCTIFGKPCLVVEDNKSVKPRVVLGDEHQVLDMRPVGELLRPDYDQPNNFVIWLDGWPEGHEPPPIETQ
ncbi:MAG TPA: hypothetical protein VFH87_14155 [Candidatus Udaeobacter sp.]|nr:hypothetical protein [Candidatus Udaeobacter sp.]